jgi:hypothetical protein
MPMSRRKHDANQVAGNMCWVRIWDHLAKMESLRSLDVDLDISYGRGYAWRGCESTALEPLRMVTRPSTFNLRVTYSEPVIENRAVGLPCNITYDCKMDQYG